MRQLLLFKIQKFTVGKQRSARTNAYPANWPAIAADIKNRAGWRCEHCDHPHDTPTGYMLTVHHLDGDKSNCSYANLVALCQRCHLRIQAQFIPGQTVMPFAQMEWMIKRGLI